jgi:hypothetical protein
MKQILLFITHLITKRCRLEVLKKVLKLRFTSLQNGDWHHFFPKFFFSTFCSLKLHFCYVILHILQHLLSCDCVILHCYHLIYKIRLILFCQYYYTITSRTNIFVKNQMASLEVTYRLSTVNCYKIQYFFRFQGRHGFPPLQVTSTA